MTPSKFKNRCPVCHRPSWRLRRHLDDVHCVRNALERRILLAFARGRVSVRGMKCPVGGCSYGGSRVAQHLQDAHRDLGAKEKKRLLRKLQWRKTLRQVRELRASGPDPPLATRDRAPAPPVRPRRTPRSGRSQSRRSWRSHVLFPADRAPALHVPPRRTPHSGRSHVFFPAAATTCHPRTRRRRPECRRSRTKNRRPRPRARYMSRDKTELGSWRFLDDAGRIMAWPAELTERERKAVTTVKVYLVNTTQFHVYFMETPPRSSRLSKRQLVSVMRALRSATCQIGTKVVLRQIKVKSEKLQRSVTPEILRRCIAKCRGWIPKLLLSSSQKKHDVGLRHLLYGFFALYLISLYGHRAGVMTNLTTEEVLEAARGADSSSPGVVLNVKNHKTARVFGCAQVFLTHEELGWIQRWMEIRARLRPQCDLVFFNTNHQHVNTITAFARNAWAAMLLPGRPSLTDIRTAVATMCRNTHSSDVRTQMSRVMCHDTRTADRFYAMQLDVGQMAEMRRRFAQCMGDEAAESSQ
ncbi:uncharacterized protein LOC116710901 [Xiphophorus hellerii]|uniref:uncharacterized protein LOC116710901 n=1 Tax=Xiphophorus hellerii TaxID=8084 RepID=UPI0013B37E69|nr:uncharacterized protein LOC116710901 [Xiphophorus hellerii]